MVKGCFFFNSLLIFRKDLKNQLALCHQTIYFRLLKTFQLIIIVFFSHENKFALMINKKVCNTLKQALPHESKCPLSCSRLCYPKRLSEREGKVYLKSLLCWRVRRYFLENYIDVISKFHWMPLFSGCFFFLLVSWCLMSNLSLADILMNKSLFVSGWNAIFQFKKRAWNYIVKYIFPNIIN